MKVPSSSASAAPSDPAEQGQEGALVGGDLHHRDLAHRRRLLLDLAQDLVLAGAVGDHVVVELVAEHGELAHRPIPQRPWVVRPPSAAMRPQAAPTKAPASPAQTAA